MPAVSCKVCGQQAFELNVEVLVVLPKKNLRVLQRLAARAGVRVQRLDRRQEGCERVRREPRARNAEEILQGGVRSKRAAGDVTHTPFRRGSRPRRRAQSPAPATGKPSLR